MGLKHIVFSATDNCKMMFKILLLAGAAFMAYRFLTKPKHIDTHESYEIDDEEFVEYEEIKEE